MITIFSLVATVTLAHPAIPSYQERDAALMTEYVIEKRHALGSETCERVVGAVLAAGAQFNIDPLFLLSVAYIESRWNPKALSKNDGGSASYGLFQIKWGWASGWGNKKKTPPKEFEIKRKKDMLDAAKATRLAAWIFDLHRRKWGAKYAATVYTCGAGCCDKYKRGRCVKKKPWTKTAKGYFRVYRELLKRYNAGEIGC